MSLTNEDLLAIKKLSQNTLKYSRKFRNTLSIDLCCVESIEYCSDVNDSP